jgi:hypothetical protein
MSRRMFGPRVVGAILVGGCLGAAGLAACSSTDPVASSPVTPGSDSATDTSATPDSTPPVGCTNTTGLKVFFTTMYSAFVTDSNMHTFQIPAIATDAMGNTAAATWTASDATAVSFAPDPATGGTLLTIKSAAAVTTITAQLGANCGSAQLNVTSATEADWQAGNARYNNGVPVYGGCIGEKVAPLLIDSGVTLPPKPDGGCPDAGPACTGCHGDKPTGGFFQGVQHTPEQTGGFSDTALTDIFVNGLDPTYDTSFLPYPYWHAFHTWSDIATPAERHAMVVYLRSLTPVDEEGGINFGQLTDSGILGD